MSSFNRNTSGADCASRPRALAAGIALEVHSAVVLAGASAPKS